MSVLVACEESGVVTTALRAKGIEAFSCDLVPTRGNPDWHIQDDIRRVLLSYQWKMVLAFPPCTHLCTSGARYFIDKQADGRQQEGIDFFMHFVDYHTHMRPYSKMMIENPVGIMSTIYRKPNQIIHPYHFGHDASKKTCLWLFNLPVLRTTKHIPSVNGRWGNQSPCGADNRGPSPTRSRDRSTTYQGIANAIAEQWSILL